MNSGFIKLYRSLRDWEYYGIPSAVTLWIHLLIAANWEDGSFRGEQVPRGSLISSVRHLATETGLSESTVRRWLRAFESAGMVTTQTSHRWTHIKVLKYSTFQDIPERPVTRQMTGPMNSQMTRPVTPNIRNKEEEEIKNSPLNPPQREGTKNRRKRGPVRIDTPDWYKRQQSGEIPEPEESDDDLIREFEEARERMNKSE